MTKHTLSRLLMLVAALFVSPAQAASWNVDTATSSLSFETMLFGSPLPGSFTQWTADIDFDAAALETSKVSVVIEMKSADTGDATRDETLRSENWFAVAEHPQATLQSTAFSQTGDDIFEMSADLTMRGKTVPVVLPFTLETVADGTRAHGAVTIDRTKFDVGQGDFVTGATVALEVTISIDVRATPAD